jgi:hypothetical protein
MTGWITFGVVLSVIVAYVVSRARAHQRLFADEHFLEVARAATGLKDAGIGTLVRSRNDMPRSAADPRTLITSRGVAIAYTVSSRDGAFVHHCSVSQPGSITPGAIGETFSIFVVRLFGLPIEKARLQVGSSMVHHVECTLDADEHEKVVATPVPVVTAANVDEMMRAALEARPKLQRRAPLATES